MKSKNLSYDERNLDSQGGKYRGVGETGKVGKQVGSFSTEKQKDRNGKNKPPKKFV